MKKIFLSLILFPLCLHAGSVELPNGGFEDNGENWVIDKSDGGKTTIVGEAAHGGILGVKVVDEDERSGSSIMSKKIAIEPGKEYQLRFWAKSIQGFGLGVYMDFYGPNGEALNTSELKNQNIFTIPKNQEEWKEFMMRATAPKNAAYLRIFIHSYGQALVQAYLDDFVLSEAQ